MSALTDGIAKAAEAALVASGVPSEIAQGLGELTGIVLAAPDQRAAIERAKFYAAADAAKLAADELLRKELG